MTAAPTLEALEVRLCYDLECLDYPRKDWTPADDIIHGAQPLDVAIIGAGQSGLALAWALRRKRIGRVGLFDAAPPGYEGPWDRYARMETLRTPKHVNALDGGLASLSFRAWYDASNQPQPWEAIDRAPTRAWMDYLRWFRRVLDLRVSNNTRLLAFEPVSEGLIRLHLDSDADEQRVLCRKLVFATGMDGGGVYEVPHALTRNLPRASWAHAYDPIDFATLRGKRVAVLGMGSAAVDNAHKALQAGCLHADLFARRPAAADFDARDWVENAGFLHGFPDLPDDLRWQVAQRLIGVSSPPPPWSVTKCTAFENCHFHHATGWLSTSQDGNAIRIDTTRGPCFADFIIFATGAIVDLAKRPEFTAHAPQITLWRDRLRPPDNQSRNPALNFPYLSSGFGIIPRDPALGSYLSSVHLFNRAATASLGVGAATVTGLSFATDRLASALTTDLYRSIAARHVKAMPWPDYAEQV